MKYKIGQVVYCGPPYDAYARVTKLRGDGTYDLSSARLEVPDCAGWIGQQERFILPLTPMEILGDSSSGPAAGFLEVGCNYNGEVVVNHPDLEPDANGVGHIVFSPAEARAFANLLLRHADTAQHSSSVQEELRQAKAKRIANALCP